jgi:hypothetical protein
VSIIYRTTLTPSKLELLAAWLPTRTWYRPTGRSPELVKAGGFRLDDPEGEVGIEFMVAVDVSGEQAVAYHVPLAYRGAPLEGYDDAVVGTAEHGVLGRRWIYDGTRDPVLVTQLVALIQGEAQAQAQGESHTPDPTVHSRPIAADPVSASGFTAIDGLTGTEVTIDVGLNGDLVIGVSRVLEAMAMEPAAELAAAEVAAVELSVRGPHGARSAEFSGRGYGYVTATWRPDAVTAGEVRGVFAIASLIP